MEVDWKWGGGKVEVGWDGFPVSAVGGEGGENVGTYPLFAGPGPSSSHWPTPFIFFYSDKDAFSFIRE